MCEKTNVHVIHLFSIEQHSWQKKEPGGEEIWQVAALTWQLWQRWPNELSRREMWKKPQTTQIQFKNTLFVGYMAFTLHRCDFSPSFTPGSHIEHSYMYDSLQKHYILILLPLLLQIFLICTVYTIQYYSILITSALVIALTYQIRHGAPPLLCSQTEHLLLTQIRSVALWAADRIGCHSNSKHMACTVRVWIGSMEACFLTCDSRAYCMREGDSAHTRIQNHAKPDWWCPTYENESIKPCIRWLWCTHF